MARDKENVSYVIMQISVRVLLDLVLIFVLVQGFAEAYNFSYKLFIDIPYKTTAEAMMDFTIEDGSSVMDIATQLEDAEIVENRYIFLARVYVGGYNGDVKAGTYKLNAAMSPDDICKRICGIQSEEAS